VSEAKDISEPTPEDRRFKKGGKKKASCISKKGDIEYITQVLLQDSSAHISFLSMALGVKPKQKL